MFEIMARRRADRRGHAAAGPPLRRRRRDPVLRHRAAARRGRDRRRDQAGRRARCSPTRSGPRPTSSACGLSIPPTDMAAMLKAVGILAAELAGAADRLRRRAVHGRVATSSREARRATTPRPRRSCAPSRRCGPRCSTGWPTSPSRRSRAQIEAGAAARSSCSTVGPARSSPEDYRGRVQPASARIFDALADLGVPAHPLRGRHRRALGGSWPRPAPMSSASTGACRSTKRRAASVRATRCRATSIPRCASRPGRSSKPRRATCSTRAAGRPGHVFNLGHGVLPETDPDVLQHLVDFVHEQLTARPRRPADGVRHAGRARRRRGVLHARTPRPPADARAAR